MTTYTRFLSLQKLLPDTLMGRSAMIVIIPSILVQIISTTIFYNNHWETLSRRLAQGLAGDITHIRVHMRDFNSADDFKWIQSVSRLTMLLKIAYEEGAALSPEKVINGSSKFDNVLTRELWREMKRPFTIDFEYSRREIAIDMQLPNGVLHILAPRKRLFSSTTYVFVLWMVGSSMLLFSVAVLFLNIQVRSVRRLARAADSFGKGHDIPDFQPEGALEVRKAAQAFNLMRNRIQKHIDQRTEMLAGVSHDLRTPLTRLKLQVEMLKGVDSNDVRDIKDDIDEMQRMLEGYLNFAKGEGEEALETIKLTTLIAYCERMFLDQGVIIETDQKVANQAITVKPLAFRRCIVNLINNAVRHGNRVILRIFADKNNIDFCIEDDGPGLIAEERENVFKAFYRVDSSRNIETGGVGLGLTIARDIARNHGGDITLSNGDLGGLKAILRIPL